MSDNNIHAAVTGDVGRVCTHTGFKLAIAADCDASQIAYFAKCPVTIVVEQRVRHVIIGNKDVLPAIIVVIEGDDAESVAGVLRQP